MPAKLGWLKKLIGGGKKNCQLLKTDTKNHPLEVFHQPTSPLYITQKSSPGSGSGTVIGRLHQQTAHRLPQALRAERLQRVAKGEATTEAGDRIAVVGLVPKPGVLGERRGKWDFQWGFKPFKQPKIGIPGFFRQISPTQAFENDDWIGSTERLQLKPLKPCLLDHEGAKLPVPPSRRTFWWPGPKSSHALPIGCHRGMGITAMGTANAKASWMLLFPPCVIKARQRFNLEIWSGWFNGLRMAQGCKNDDVFSMLDYTPGTW